MLGAFARTLRGESLTTVDDWSSFHERFSFLFVNNCFLLLLQETDASNICDVSFIILLNIYFANMYLYGRRMRRSVVRFGRTNLRKKF